MSSKHANNQRGHPNIACNDCGILVESLHKMAEHLEVCDSTFKTVKNKVCKFFVNGGCNKDDLSCKFLHPENKGTNEKVPACRNGPRCKYLISGVCAFFHRGVGVQTQNQQTQMNRERRWCRFLEDCNRVPNCPFKHVEEDFPMLQNTNNPPIATAARVWQMY